MPIPFTAYEVDPLPPVAIIFGHSKAMKAVREAMEKVAATTLSILVSGESGTGKELIAKAIHRASPWWQAPFLKVSCPTLRAPLLSGDLVRSAENDEVQETPPEVADFRHRGTLFFDRVCELSLPLQGQFLGLFQENLIGSGTEENVWGGLRIICSSTGLNLEAAVKAGNFRQDLFHNLSEIRMEVPPLRKRRQDIPLILNYLLEFYSKSFHRPVVPISASLAELLQKCEWPGNILQLENLAKRYVLFGPEDPMVAELALDNAGKTYAPAMNSSIAPQD